MPANSRSKRKSERRCKSTRSSKFKKTVEIVNNNNVETFENGCDVVSSILGENRKSDDKIDDEIVSIASDTLLCLEEVYCDTNSTQQAMSPISNWGSEMSCISLVIGEADEAMVLRNKIQQLTSCHDVQICKQEESFELCNSKTFVLVWLMMTMPVGPDILSLTTSIRYASKFNRGTVIIGVANATSTVDLRLHGIDEIVIQPVDGDVIRQKYSKWTSITIVPADLVCSENEEKSVQSETQNSKTSSSERGCGLSISVDNNMMGHLNLTQLGGLNVYKCMTTPIGQHSGKQRHLAATDHTTKEKVRRERIKDSCDQLRVLLPYIRGRKTDMASILEMCVDYLKLVNAALPQDFQNQIVEILAKDSCLPDSPAPNEKKSKSKMQDMDSNVNSNAVSSTVDTDINNNEVRSNSYGGQNQNETVNDKDLLAGSKSTKRLRSQSDSFVMTTSSQCVSSAVTSVNPFETIKVPKAESTVIDPPQSSYSYNGGHHSLYNEYEALPRYSTHDTYPSTYYGSPLTSKQNGLDRDSFGLYLDPQPFYQFCSSSGMCPYMGPIPDYVNPNAILPVSYNTGKPNHGGTSYEEQDNIVSSQQSALASEERTSKQQ